MIKWEAWFDHVIPYLRDVPTPIARMKIIEAARTFCERSGALRLTIDQTPTIAGVAEYDVSVLRNADVVKIVQAQLDGAPLVGLTAFDYDQRVAARNEPSTPQWIVFRDGFLQLYPTPDSDGLVLTATVTVKPSFRASGLPRDLASRYMEVIATGARAALMAMKDKPYSDPVKAKDDLNLFIGMCGEANIEVEMSYADADLHVTGYYE